MQTKLINKYQISDFFKRNPKYAVFLEIYVFGDGWIESCITLGTGRGDILTVR